MATTLLVPTSAALAATGGTPSFVTGIGIFPDQIELTAVGDTPTLITGVNSVVAPTAGGLVTTRDVPTITGATTVLESSASTIVVSGASPLVTVNPPSLPDLIWNATREQKLNEENIRRKQPLTRLWNAEWQLQHVLGNEYKAQFSFISNDTGPGQIEIPFDSPAAKWVHDHQGRIARGEGRNVFITVDHCGARWSGIMDKYSVEKREDGDVVLVIDFLHDYEFL